MSSDTEQKGQQTGQPVLVERGIYKYSKDFPKELGYGIPNHYHLCVKIDNTVALLSCGTTQHGNVIGKNHSSLSLQPSYINRTMSEISDVINLINHSASTFSNIAQMTQYRMKYVLNRDVESKQKMIYHTCLAGLCIAGLFTFGIAGLINKE